MAEKPRPRVVIKLKGRTIAGQAGSRGQVKKRLQQLGYPGPDCSVDALAKALNLNARSPKEEPPRTFPTWQELMAELSASRASPACAPNLHKRTRSSPQDVDSGPNKRSRSEPADAPQQAEQPVQACEASQPGFPSQLAKAEVAQDVIMVTAAQAGKAGDGFATAGNLSSSSTTFGFCLGVNTSPPEVSPADPMPAPAPLPLPAQQSQQQEAAHQVLLPPPQPQQEVVALPSTGMQQRENAHSVGTQTTHYISLVPPQMFPSLQPAVGSQPKAVQLSQMMLPPHKCYLPVPADLANAPACEAQVKQCIDTAVERKRQAERLRGGGTLPWTPVTLSLYVDSALHFLKALECLLRMPATPERNSRASNLCMQTADFLMFTVRACETASAGHMVRECLRTLCERLSALCLMRECTLSAHRYKDHADRLERLMEKSAAGRAAAGGGGGPAHEQGGRSAAVNGPSPDSSHASSHDAAATAQQQHSRPPHLSLQGELGLMQGKVIAAVRQTARFADVVRKSVLSFQALSEREDVRSNETAMMVCMHISALSLGGGLMDCSRAIAHAYETLACIKAL